MCPSKKEGDTEWKITSSQIPSHLPFLSDSFQLHPLEASPLCGEATHTHSFSLITTNHQPVQCPHSVSSLSPSLSLCRILYFATFAFTHLHPAHLLYPKGLFTPRATLSASSSSLGIAPISNTPQDIITTEHYSHSLF